MLKTNSGGYAMDYVYSSSESDTFRSVHVDLQVIDEDLQLTLISNDEIKIVDLENILKSLQEEKFSRMRISIYEDCNILLKVNDSSHKVNLLNRDMKIDCVQPL